MSQRKRTAAEKGARRKRKKKFVTIFIHGKQKRVPRPPLIDGLPLEEFLSRNADAIWLHQNEFWDPRRLACPLANVGGSDCDGTQDRL